MRAPLDPGKRYAVQYGRQVRKDLKLLEVDPNVLEEIRQGSVVVKGAADSEAVLCTDAATYSLKHVETTNSIVLMPVQQVQSAARNQCPLTIQAAAHSHLELVQVAPDFNLLDKLLKTHMPQDTATEVTESSSPSYTFDELLSSCQASAQELREALKLRKALETDGRWRILDCAHFSTLFNILLLTAAQQGWSLTSIPAEEAAAALHADGYDPREVLHCLRVHGQVCNNDPNSFTLDPQKVCLHTAGRILASKAQWTLSEFKIAWTAALPEEYMPQMAMLAGEILIEEVGPDKVILPFSSSSLPEDPAQRFAALFRIRSQWLLTDLEPYLKSMKAPGWSVESLLLKYCRVCQQNPGDPQQYSAR